MDDKKEEENNHDEEKKENSWWGSLPVWFQSAKEKSSTALELMKRDLSELSQTVQTDAAAAITTTAALLKDKLMIDSADSVATKAKESITSILGTITDAFIPQKELEDSEMVMIRNSEPVTLDWWQAQLHLIRKDPKTYCHEPEGPPELYENWLAAFDIDEHQVEVKDMMRSCSVVRALYEDLVPSAVSDLEFWQRYFYRLHLLRRAEARRAELLKRAEEITLDNIEWEEDDASPQISRAGHISASSKTSHTVSYQSLQSQSPIVPRDSGAVSKLKNVCPTSRPIAASTTDNFIQVPQKESSNDSTKLLGASDLTVESDANENYKLVVNNRDSVKQTILTEVTDNQLSEDRTPPGNKNGNEVNSEDQRAASPQSNESASKDSSTGDEWEKDFDLDVPESDLKISDETVMKLIETDELENRRKEILKTEVGWSKDFYYNR